MTMTILERAIYDTKEEFNLESAGIKSLLHLLEFVILDCEHVTTIAINDPAHPTQQMHAIVKAVMRQFDAADAMVQSIPSK